VRFISVIHFRPSATRTAEPGFERITPDPLCNGTAALPPLRMRSQLLRGRRPILARPSIPAPGGGAGSGPNP